MEYLKNTYALVATVIALILGYKSCSKEPSLLAPEVISRTIYVDSSRTNYEHYKDSVENWVHFSYSEIPEIKKDGVVTRYIYLDNKTDSVAIDSIVLNNPIDTFYYGKKDSLLEYSIRVYGVVKPSKIEMEYNILNKIYKDSVYVRDSIHVEQKEKVRVNQLYVGFETNITPELDRPYLTLDLVTKKGWMYGAGIGYDFNDNQKYIKAKIAKVISFRKKQQR